jgi:hypothetical protein
MAVTTVRPYEHTDLSTSAQWQGKGANVASIMLIKFLIMDSVPCQLLFPSDPQVLPLQLHQGTGQQGALIGPLGAQRAVVTADLPSSRGLTPSEQCARMRFNPE